MKHHNARRVASLMLAGLLAGPFLFAQRAETPTDAAVASTSVRPEKIELSAIDGGSFHNGKYKMKVGTLLVGTYEVTQRQYAAVMGSLPASCAAEFGLGDDYPVYFVTWYDAIVFCNRLSSAEGLTPVYAITGSKNPDEWGQIPNSSNTVWNAIVMDKKANGYRLPTEAEWEYAARGGQGKSMPAYSGSGNADEVAWTVDNSGSTAHPVGEKKANQLGLYDMSGNVFEWCFDWLGDYTGKTRIDLKGKTSGAVRVFRGGSWYRDARFCAVSYRDGTAPQNTGNANGFRVVRQP